MSVKESSSPENRSVCHRPASRKDQFAMLMNEANAMLRGGPSSYLPDDERVRYVPDPNTTLKLMRGNHYEHFEPTAEKVGHGDRELQVFVWSGCTYIAE